MSDLGRRHDLADFLRAKRAGLSPVELGLPVHGRRRTPGLRREEVAMLADVSVTWYTFLEQGRPISISVDALTRVAGALRLGPAETRHLVLLANRRPHRTAAREEVPDVVVDFICSLDRSPAWLVNPRYDVLHWNPAARLWVDLDAIPAEERNLLWLLLTRPEVARMHVDWEGDARRMMAALRARHAEHRDDARFNEIIDRLTDASPFFRDWWRRHEVEYEPSLVIDLDHPQLGKLRFSATAHRPEAAPGLRLLVWTADAETQAHLSTGG